MRKVFRVSIVQVILLGAFFFCSGKIFSQSIGNQIFIGLNGSQIDGDQYAGYNKAGLFLGWGAYLPIKSEKLNFHFSLLYSQKGARTKNDPNSLTNTLWKQNLHYIDVPLYLEYNIWDKLNLATGFVPGYLVAAQVNTGFGNVTNTTAMEKISLEYLVDANYKVLDNIGLGVRFNYSVLNVRPNVGWYNNIMTFYASFYL